MADLEKFKLSSLFWEGDKNEEGFFVFLENFGNMVRSTASGFHLENMLDSKLRRASMMKGSVPSCLLLDSDFAVFSPPQGLNSTSAGAEAEASAEAEDDSASVNVASAAVSSAITGSTFTLGTHSVAYHDLPAAAKTLDAMLLSIFKLSIKRSKQALLQCVTFPSYVQAVIILVKHMDISRKRSMASPRQCSSRSQMNSTKWMWMTLISISTACSKAIVQTLLQ